MTDKETKPVITCNLSAILGKKRIKVSKVARETKIAESTLHHLYHEDTKGITFDVLAKLCKYLDCKVEDLLEYKEVEPEENN